MMEINEHVQVSSIVTSVELLISSLIFFHDSTLIRSFYNFSLVFVPFQRSLPEKVTLAFEERHRFDSHEDN